MRAPIQRHQVVLSSSLSYNAASSFPSSASLRATNMGHKPPPFHSLFYLARSLIISLSDGFPFLCVLPPDIVPAGVGTDVRMKK